jgi:hypothetical protein
VDVRCPRRNEAEVVLFNPYLTFLLVCLGAAYVVFQLGPVGPVMSIERTVFGEVGLLPLSSRLDTNSCSEPSKPHITRTLSQPPLAAPDQERSAERQESIYTTNGSLSEDEMEQRELSGHIS